MEVLLADWLSAGATTTAVEYIRQLFATPRAPGIQLAVQALDIAADQSTVTTTLTGYAQDLLSHLRS